MVDFSVESNQCTQCDFLCFRVIDNQLHRSQQICHGFCNIMRLFIAFGLVVVIQNVVYTQHARHLLFRGCGIHTVGRHGGIHQGGERIYNGHMPCRCGHGKGSTNRLVIIGVDRIGTHIGNHRIHIRFVIGFDQVFAQLAVAHRPWFIGVAGGVVIQIETDFCALNVSILYLSAVFVTAGEYRGRTTGQH